MLERFTERARRVVFFAEEEAGRLGENYVSTEHLLLGLIRENDSVAARILDRMGVSLGRIRSEIERQVTRGDGLGQVMQFTPRSKRVIDFAYDEARRLSTNYIGTEHLLLGLIRESEGLAGRILAKLGANIEAARSLSLSFQEFDITDGLYREQTKTIVHNGKISWSHDGLLLTSPSPTAAVYIYRYSVGKTHLIHQFRGHSKAVQAVSWSNGDYKIASGSRDKTIRIWELEVDLETPKILESGHRDDVPLTTSDNVMVMDSGGTGYIAANEKKYKPNLFTRFKNSLRRILNATDIVYDITEVNNLTVNIIDTAPSLKEVQESNVHVTGRLLKTLFGHAGVVTHVVCCPAQPILASASSDQTIRCWDTRTGEQIGLLDLRTAGVRIQSNYVTGLVWSHIEQTLTVSLYQGEVFSWNYAENTCKFIHRFAGLVRSIAYSVYQKLFVAALENIIIILDEKGKIINRVEGHTNSIIDLTVSTDGTLLASRSLDDTIRLWNIQSMQPLVSMHEAASSSNYGGVAFRPGTFTLALYNSDAKSLVITTMDPLFLNQSSSSDYVRYTSAKIVLVGESNVGKSCLALRLAMNDYEEQGTTHGLRFWPMKPEQLGTKAVGSSSEKRDVMLWDMGGQDEYRLVHQLFLHDTTLALLLCDPTRERIAFEEVEGWNKRLEQQLQGRPAKKLLVATKLDEPDPTIDKASIERLIHKCGFAGYIEVSAKKPRGIAELCEAICDALDWDMLATTSRPHLFQKVREEIEVKRDAGEAVLLYLDLEDTIRGDDPDNFQTSALDETIEQLAVQGLISDTRLSTGERTLILRVDQVERYAGSLIIAARNNMRGVPAIEERMIASPQMRFPRIEEDQRLPRLQERIVLECVVQLLLEHGICVLHEGLLVFPSLFRPTEEENTEKFTHSISLCYDFSGAIDNIYSSLVAWLAISERFGGMRLWDDRAEFEQAGQGACGMRKVGRNSGFAHLDVYFEEKTSQETRDLFISFVEAHVRQHGVDIYERVEITCACGYPFSEETVRERVAEGKTDVGCPRCDNRTLISEGAQKARQRNPELTKKTWALRTEVEQKKKEVVGTAKKVFTMPDITETLTEPLRILHLSDLHFTSETDPVAMLQPLIADLKDRQGGLGVEQLDYLVVSGDMSHTDRPEEFEKAREFVSALIAKFKLTANQCIMIPGNHDLSWDEPVYTWKPIRQVMQQELKDGCYVVQGEGYLLRQDDIYPTRFKNFSESFYHKIVQQEYPSKFENQCTSFLFPETGIQFLALNSCWEIDEYYRKRSSIHPGALARGLDKAEDDIQRAKQSGELPTHASGLRIGVWHHAVTGTDKIENDAFLEQLQKANFKLCLHGDVHELRADLVGYRHSRQIYVAGAGAFGASAQGRPESTPRLYSLLEVSQDHSTIRVHTRRQLKGGGSYEGYAVWPGERPHEHKDYYEIDL